MRRHPETKSIFRQYSQLKKAAHEARYEATPFQASDIVHFEGLHQIVRDAMVKAITP
jgi:hypothetical protein